MGHTEMRRVLAVDDEKDFLKILKLKLGHLVI